MQSTKSMDTKYRAIVGNLHAKERRVLNSRFPKCRRLTTSSHGDDLRLLTIDAQRHRPLEETAKRAKPTKLVRRRRVQPRYRRQTPTLGNGDVPIPNRTAINTSSKHIALMLPLAMHPCLTPICERMNRRRCPATCTAISCVSHSRRSNWRIGRGTPTLTSTWKMKRRSIAVNAFASSARPPPASATAPPRRKSHPPHLSATRSWSTR